MNYELAKELEVKGFPYTNEMYRRELVCSQNSYGHLHTRGCGELLPVPSLSELIIACGDDFGSLTYETFKQYKTGVPGWFAREANELRNFNESGSTPEEAVARLWLSLNKDADNS